MEDNKILKLVYAFFLGLLLAIFVGVGINTFYPPPPEPKYPIELNTYGKDLNQAQIKNSKIMIAKKKLISKNSSHIIETFRS